MSDFPQGPEQRSNETAHLDECNTQCSEMIRVGSKSFSLAARLFAPGAREAAFFLYGWCRYTDDQVDGAGSKEQAIAHLNSLKALTSRCYEVDTTPLKSQTRESGIENTVFTAFSHVTRHYRIPKEYPLELLEGMAMDVQGQEYRSLEDLKLYCYRVASTVGLMMVHVMGVSDEKALKYASDLGMAMQMTNIARDVLEDFEMGRVYLPSAWLSDEGLSPQDVGNPEKRKHVAQVVARLLQEAKKYYDSGREGFAFLPFRSALAVAAACCVYEQIGTTVLSRGEKAWDTRTIVPQWKKVLALAKGVFQVLLTIPTRIIKPWAPAPITIVRRYS